MVPIEIRAAAAIAIFFDMFFSPGCVLVCFVVSASQLDGPEPFARRQGKKRERKGKKIKNDLAGRAAFQLEPRGDPLEPDFGGDGDNHESVILHSGMSCIKWLAQGPSL